MEGYLCFFVYLFVVIVCFCGFYGVFWFVFLFVCGVCIGLVWFFGFFFCFFNPE